MLVVAVVSSIAGLLAGSLLLALSPIPMIVFLLFLATRSA
jgi:hypothetical protein